MATRHARALALCLACVGLASAACSKSNGTAGEGTDPPFDRGALLQSEATNVLLPTYAAFERDAATLRDATAALAAAHATAADPAAALTAAREGWRAAMRAWQEAEVLQLGPAAPSARGMGGRDLRDAVYSWPTVSACRVDQELVAARYGEPAFFETALVNVRGLAAIEYLLFHEGATNACPPQATLNTSGAWAALDAATLARRRAEYATAAAADVATHATALRTAWDPTGGNFAAELATAGAGSATYSTARSAVDALFAALFYVELVVKDAKLAAPAGLNQTCPVAACPELAESPWARHAQANVVANLRGFRRAFTGGDGTGFDDALVALGAAELSTRMLASCDAAIAAVEAVPPPLNDAFTAAPEPVHHAYDAVKTLTDDVKTQFVSVLGLAVPQEGAGDND